MTVVIAEDDYDLQRAWDETLRAFAKESKVELKPDHVLTVDEVLAQLKSKRDKDDADAQKYAVVKDVVGKTLVVIQTFGSIVAAAASPVFGPANQCFAAISLLINAGQNYSNIFSNFADLFKQMSDVLERMALYLKSKSIDLPLRKILHELLQNVISICSLSHKVLHGNKFLKALKVLAFNDDDGVQAAVAKLRSLVDREAQMKTTLTYLITKEGFQDTKESLTGVQAAVNKLTMDSQRRDLESEEAKQQLKIKTALGIQKEYDTQTQLHARLRAETVEGTGKWLLEEPSFKHWADREQQYSKIVFLSANEGYGKTFLLSSVVRGLQRIYARQADSHARTTVAYYYLQPKDSKAMHNDSDNSWSVEKVVKTLALQLAQDPVYRKDLSMVCENWIEPENEEDLIAKLLDPCYKSDEVFYLIVDGVDQADEKQLAAFSLILNHVCERFSEQQRTHVRILLSGRVDVIRQFAAGLAYPSAVIDVAKNNGSDVDIFIHDRLGSLKLLHGDTEQMRNLREEVFKSLSESAHGDFVNVDLLIKELGTKSWPAEIRLVLEAAKSGTFQRADTIAREITRCNDTLSDQEIRDLNTLLLWVISAKQTLTIKELNAALFLENKESSLRPLHEQIRDKYSAFFHVEEEESFEGADAYTVSLSSDSIHDHFKNVQSQNAIATKSGSAIQDSEIKIIRRFLSSVCDQELYEKFGFEDFFAQKQNKSSTLIGIDLENAPVALTLGCLEAIISSSEEVKPLLTYAVSWWPLHLADGDSSLASPADKITLGVKLSSIFTNVEIIPKWWIKPDILSKHGWFFVDENVEIVVNWFRDTAVTKTFSPELKDWVKKLTSNTAPDADLLEHVAKHLAKEIVTNSEWDSTAIFSALQAFRTRIQHRKDPSVERIQKVLLANSGVTADQIKELFEWASKLNEIDLDGRYQPSRCLARCLRLYGCVDDAAKQYEKAITLTSDNWYAQYGLANLYFEKGEWQKSIDLLQVVMTKTLNGEAKDEDPKRFIQYMRATLAASLRKLERYQDAQKAYDDILLETPTDYSIYLAKMQTFAETKDYHGTIALLDSMHAEKDPQFGIALVSRFMHVQTATTGTDFTDAVIKAGKEAKLRDRIVAAFQKSIEDIDVPAYLPGFPKVKALWRVLLIFVMAEEAWKLAMTPEKQQEVVDMWEKLMPDALDIGQAFFQQVVAKRLVNVYADKLRAIDPTSQEAADLVKQIADLAVEDSVEQGVWESGTNTNFLVARWQRSLGHDAEAMALLKGTMKIGFDLLSDQDDSNDWEGYYRLGNALMYYGDLDNALAAWSLVWPAKGEVAQKLATAPKNTNGSIENLTNGDTHDDESQHADSTNNDDLSKEFGQAHGTLGEDANDNEHDEAQVSLSLTCDGECGKDWDGADDIYFCLDCIDVAFNEECLTIHKAGELPINICNPKHEFLHVPEWNKEEALKRGKDKVRLRGENVPAAQWVRDMKQAWGFDTVGTTKA